MNQLMWVSEWRIEPASKLEGDFGYIYKITNGGVYSSSKSAVEAQQKLEREIKEEMQQYIINNLQCPNCGTRFADHERSYELCLIQLSLHQFTGKRL